MELLKERILKDGRVFEGDILKVDRFLNHQLDVNLLNEIGKAFKAHFHDIKITKILTAEVSGIAIAVIAAQYFNVPVVFAKKFDSVNIAGDAYEGLVYSYTKQKTYHIRVSKEFLSAEDSVLILDDFLANGEAIKGLKQIIDLSGAKLQGVGVVIEKSYQPGREKLRAMGVEVKALAKIKTMHAGEILFED